MFDKMLDTNETNDDDRQRRTKKSHKRSKMQPDLSSIDLIELSPAHVNAALSSLISTDHQIQSSGTSSFYVDLQATRKRARTKSHQRSIEKAKKKCKHLVSNELPSPPTTNEAEDIVLAISGLTSKQIKQVKKFVLLFNCRLLFLDDQSIFNPSITHLITDEIESNDSLICTLTKTVVFAIAQHCFILSYRWISQCLEENRLLNEEQFEIEGDHLFAVKHNGPRRSRLAKQPLFPMNYFLMIKGSSGHFLDFTNRDLNDLAWLAGGISLEQNRFPNTVFSRQCFLVIEDEDIRNKTMFHRCIDKGLKFLRSEWLIRSIVEYRMADITHYHCDPFETIDRSSS